MDNETFSSNIPKEPGRIEYIAAIQQKIRTAVNNKPVSVYYPGIGGGEEPIDTAGPFSDIDADEVYGIDMFSEEIPLNKIAPIENKLTKVETDVKMIADDPEDVQIINSGTSWTATFKMKGRKRKLRISKRSLDARTYIPKEQYPVIYTARSYRLITHLPPQVIDNASAIIDIEQYKQETESVKAHFSQNPLFSEVDLQAIPGVKAVMLTIHYQRPRSY